MLLAQYKNGNYTVRIYDDGTKIRFNDLDNLTPDFAESIDCTITMKCDGGCKYCYLGCNPQGKHADLNQPFFDTLHRGTELALNANDMSHPDLYDFLKRMRDKGVICNLTINQKHFSKFVDTLKQWQDEGLIHGVGVSLTNSSDEILWTHPLKDVVIHTIDGLLSKQDLENLADHDLKILILGYKILGRGIEYYNEHKDEIEENIQYLSDNIMTTYKNRFKVIAFDTLSCEHFDLKSKVSSQNWALHHMGEEGSYTFFIDAVNKAFAVSSLESNNVYPIEDNVDTMFHKVRHIQGFE